jgi:hypothetical protein
MLFPMDLKIKIENVRCQDPDENNGAEPYLWVIYFKVDGDTAWVDTTQAYLQGTATVVATPGNHGNLGVSHAHAGDDISVPAVLGEWHTVLKPIPVRVDGATPLDYLDAAVGFVVVLMEEDSTNDHILSRAHEALNAAVQGALNRLLPKLTMTHPRPSPEEIKALTDQVESEVRAAIKDEASLWDWLAGAGDMDDRIGVGVHQFSARQLDEHAQGGIVAGASIGGIWFRSYWRNEGEWDLTGHIYANPIVQFTPLTPTTLTPVIGGPGASWDGTWHGMLPTGTGPAIVVDIVAGSPTGHTVDVRELLFHPPVTAHASNVETSDEIIITPYANDVWTFPQTVAPAHSRVVHALQAQASRMAPAGPTSVHAVNSAASPAMMPRPTGELAPTEPVPQAGSRAPSRQSGASGEVEIAKYRMVDQLTAAANLSLSLYAEVGAQGAVDSYRIRYQRSRPDGATVEDVMLTRYVQVH